MPIGAPPKPTLPSDIIRGGRLLRPGELAERVSLLEIHVADITSNLAWQVRGNTNLIGGLGKTIIDADDLVEGLKREWYLRGPFKKKAAKKAETK